MHRKFVIIAAIAALLTVPGSARADAGWEQFLTHEGTPIESTRHRAPKWRVSAPLPYEFRPSGGITGDLVFGTLFRDGVTRGAICALQPDGRVELAYATSYTATFARVSPNGEWAVGTMGSSPCIFNADGTVLPVTSPFVSLTGVNDNGIAGGLELFPRQSYEEVLSGRYLLVTTQSRQVTYSEWLVGGFLGQPEGVTPNGALVINRVACRSELWTGGTPAVAGDPYVILGTSPTDETLVGSNLKIGTRQRPDAVLVEENQVRRLFAGQLRAINPRWLVGIRFQRGRRQHTVIASRAQKRFTRLRVIGTRGEWYPLAISASTDAILAKNGRGEMRVLQRVQ